VGARASGAQLLQRAVGRKRARASAGAAAAEQGAEEGASSEAAVSEFVGRMTREEVRSRTERAERAGAAAERGGAWGAQEEAATCWGSEAAGERYTSLPPGMAVLDSGADSGERGCFGEGDEDAPWGGTREFPAGARPRASELGASGDADWSSSREPPPEVPL
jgi:hypothetical protein